MAKRITNKKGINIIAMLLLTVPSIAFAECAEYQIIDRGNSVEAVCVGMPSTEAEKMENNRDRKIQEKERTRQEVDEANRVKRQNPPEDFDKCYHETFAKSDFKGVLGYMIFDELAKNLCRMSIERKECVTKMIDGKITSLYKYNIFYKNALEACH